MARRGYSNVASTINLIGTMDNVSVTNTITVAVAPTGWPGTLPYFAVIDPQTASEEVVLVTALAGTSLTVTRGGSIAVPYGALTKTHANGAVLKHVASAADFDEANAHVNAVGAVHGLTGSIVGTSDVQTLTNKTLGAGTVLPANAADLSSVQTLSGKTLAAPVATSVAVTDVALVVKGVAAQSGNLQDWRDSTAAVLASVNNGGGFGAVAVQINGTTGVFYSTAGSGSNSLFLNGAVNVVPRTVNEYAVSVRGLAGQSALLTSWQNSAAAVVAAVTNTGNVTSTGTVTVLSDFSAKENISPLPAGALDAVLKLKPVRFDYIDGDTDHAGFIAQDVAEVLPHAVVLFDDERKGLREGAILATLVAAVQELSAKLEVCQAELANRPA